jgi:hypothetical protein
VKAQPSRSKYAHFHVGEIETDRGPLAVGKITLGGGHASTAPGITYQAAAEHYDDAGTAVAAVRAGEDKYGIWISGVALPGQEEKFATLPLFPLSGDWRTIGGHMEMIAALAVNTPGLPIVRLSERGGRVNAMVAAGIVGEFDGYAEGALTADGRFESLHKRGFGGKFMEKLIGHHDGDGKDAGAGGGTNATASDMAKMTHAELTRHATHHPFGHPARHHAETELARRHAARMDAVNSGEIDAHVESSAADHARRATNLKRLAVLEKQLNGDKGLDSREKEEYDRLRKLYKPTKQDLQDRERRVSDPGSFADANQVVRAFRAEAEAARQARIVTEGLADLDEFTTREQALQAASVF